MSGGERKQEILSALSTLFEKGQVIEVRIIGEEGIASGYFDDFDQAAEKILILDDHRTAGTYVTLNEVNPALLARRVNRVKMRLSRKDSTTADGDITRRRYLPVDIDPVRPSGVSSSEQEHTAAIARADSIAAYLSGLGWPEPIIGDSGNGAHLLYRIDLPNDTSSRDLVAGCLTSLHTRFSDDICTIDRANFNASRIWKLYGTVSRKGDNTRERPHRKSRIISVPGSVEPVGIEDLKRLATLFPKTEPEEKKVGENLQINLADWLIDHDLPYRSKPYQGGTLFILDECPFSTAHTDGAYAIQFKSGAVYAGCHHDSCGGGRQRWKELRERFEGKKPDIGERLKKIRDERAILKAGEGISPSSSDPTEDSIREEALSILKEGDPLTFMLETFARDHVGDEVVAECLLMSLSSRIVCNSKGLHVSITGESGKGKSHTIDTMLSQVPCDLRLDGRMSDKALFYINDMKPGTVIALDDVSLSDQMQEILKGVTTSFQKPFRYRTVSKDRTGQVCVIPERCVWWVAKVEGGFDDQVFNRMLTCWIDDTEEQDTRVLTRMLADAEQVPEGKPETRREIRVARWIWRELRPVWVVIPYASRIQFQTAENRRNPDMLLDLVKAQVALRQLQRERIEDDGLVSVVASEEDFYRASRLYDALNGKTGGQATKLTKREATLIDAIRGMDSREVSIYQMQQATGWTNSAISKLLNGYNSRGQVYTGLLEKCPAIAFLDRTDITSEDGLRTYRRIKVFTWDEMLYKAWVKGGSVRLLKGSPPDDRDDLNDPSDHGKEGDGDGPVAAGRGDLLRNETESAGFADPSARDPDEERALIKEEKDILSYRSIRAEDLVCSGSCEDHQGSVSVSAYESAGAENDPVLPGCVSPIQNQAENSGRMGAENAVNSRDGAEISITAVRSRDYTPLEGWPDMARCSVCGKRPTYYRERMTPERKKGTLRPDRMLCRSCYTRATQREIASILSLPGVIDTSRMRPFARSLGRCSLCDTGPVTWYDPESRTGLCDACYRRESERKGRPGP